MRWTRHTPKICLFMLVLFNTISFNEETMASLVEFGQRHPYILALLFVPKFSIIVSIAEQLGHWSSGHDAKIPS